MAVGKIFLIIAISTTTVLLAEAVPGYPYDVSHNGQVYAQSYPYHFGYNYVTSGYGERYHPFHTPTPQFSIAKVKKEQTNDGYQFSISESGPHHHKHVHQTASTVKTLVPIAPAFHPHPVPVAGPGPFDNFNYNYNYPAGPGPALQYPVHHHHVQVQPKIVFNQPEIHRHPQPQFVYKQPQIPVQVHHVQEQPKIVLKQPQIQFQPNVVYNTKPVAVPVTHQALTHAHAYPHVQGAARSFEAFSGQGQDQALFYGGGPGGSPFGGNNFVFQDQHQQQLQPNFDVTLQRQAFPYPYQGLENGGYSALQGGY